MSDSVSDILFTRHYDDPEHPYTTARWRGGKYVQFSTPLLMDADPAALRREGDLIYACQYTLRIVHEDEAVIMAERVWTPVFQGTRIDSKLPEQPGDYGLMTDGHWWAKVPQPGFSTGILSGHDITVHKDGTITVSPSILMDMGNGKVWHGYLERGIWREV